MLVLNSKYNIEQTGFTDLKSFQSSNHIDETFPILESLSTNT